VQTLKVCNNRVQVVNPWVTPHKLAQNSVHWAIENKTCIKLYYFVLLRFYDYICTLIALDGTTTG